MALLVLLTSANAHLTAQTSRQTPRPASSGGSLAPDIDRFVGAGVSAALAQHRTSTISDVHYALSLDVREHDVARGSVTVHFTRSGTSDVVLDFRGPALRLLSANAMSLDATSLAIWNGAHIRIPARALHRGRNVITAQFDTPISAAGASIIRTHDATDGSDYLYTLLVPSDANLLFPCFDQPNLKARVLLTLITPPTWRALANGASPMAQTTVAPAASNATSVNSVKTSTSTSGVDVVHTFSETMPISTYLIAFAAGPWRTATASAQVGNAPLALWVRASRAADAESDSIIAMNARALTWLGDWFGVPYPFGKFAALLAPAFPFGGMEHPGAVFYNEESFIYRERPTMTQLLGRQATVYHEVAHQWFGDYVTMQWFDDLWLKEGFATFMAARMQAALDPASNAWKTFYLRNKPVAYATDASAGTTPVWQSLVNLDQAKSNYGPIVYNKAPSLLRQLEYTVGERAFQRGVQAFLRQHAFGNATWRDLLGSIATAAHTDLSSWGAAWILRPGMPIIDQHVELTGVGVTAKISSLTLTQRAAQPTVSGRVTWPIATQLLLYYQDRPPVKIPVRMMTSSITVAAAAGLPAPAFVFANYDDFAYALVLPDSASATWLEQHIETVRDDLLRAMLWGAMWDLVRDARFAPSRYIAMALRAVPTEPDEQIAAALIGRVTTALSRYVSPAERRRVLPDVAVVLMAGARDEARPYGVRKAQLDATISLADDSSSLVAIDRWLDADSALGIALRPPTRWAIVTQLVARNAPSAARRLRTERQRDSTTEGKRQAFVAGAARPDQANKQAYFTRWFNDADLNEEWVTSSLRAFHDPQQATLTGRFVVPALDSLPWIQANRRIFFLGSWIAATFGGQRDASALGTIDEWIASHPLLAHDLHQKVMQARDELERTVAIRKAYP